MRHYLLSLSFLLLLAGLNAQSVVSGTITEADGTPLIGVTILEKGSTSGTVTDVDGSYLLELTGEDPVLVFSYTGFSSQELAIGNQRTVDLILETDVANLDEVIVVGYGVQKKKVVTGAISKVDGDLLNDMPVLRIENSLLGRTSGVRVTTNSGQPGESSTVRIRGTTTIGNSDPLYVVDGVIVGGGIDYLNQSDIESIEVLKDAASAGIYGARAAMALSW